MLAATPPLEALKMLFSMAVTKGKFRNDAARKIDMIDMRRPFFRAEAQWEIYVDLPPWDREPGKCGWLETALYGTRDAPLIWHEHFETTLIQTAFKPSLLSTHLCLGASNLLARIFW